MSDKETAPTIPQLALEMRDLAHMAWTDPKKAPSIYFREIERRAQKISAIAAEHRAPALQPTAKEFYEANATNIVNVPRPNHPEDPSGWAGVRRASQAQFIAKDVLCMPLWDVFDFAEKYARYLREGCTGAKG